jgi:hypothetical protein
MKCTSSIDSSIKPLKLPEINRSNFTWVNDGSPVGMNDLVCAVLKVMCCTIWLSKHINPCFKPKDNTFYSHLRDQWLCISELWPWYVIFKLLLAKPPPPPPPPYFRLPPRCKWDCALLVCYAALNFNSVPTFRGNLSRPFSKVLDLLTHLQVGLIDCPETSVR